MPKAKSVEDLKYQEAEEVEEQPVDAVVVIKERDEQGNISTKIVLQGVEATEVQTLLELGIAGWRSQIGLTR